MDQILGGLDGVRCYLDDIAKTEQEHLDNLDATLQRLEEYGLRSKCECFQGSVEYLGHVIVSAGLHKAPSKIKAIVEAPTPQNVSQLRSYLLNYYGKFIPSLFSRLRPLHQLLCQGQAWKWTEQCEAAFAKSKEALLEADTL